MSLVFARSLAGSVVILFAAAVAPIAGASPEGDGSTRSAVVANDNRQPAGRLDGGTLRVSLRAGRGSWQPEGSDGPWLSIEALGEESAALMVTFVINGLSWPATAISCTTCPPSAASHRRPGATTGTPATTPRRAWRG